MRISAWVVGALAGLVLLDAGIMRVEAADSLSSSPEHQIVCSGAAAGGYAAFPDLCRTKSGDLLCVFYSGYTHISPPKAGWPNGGRIMICRSRDAGRTWGPPAVLADTPHDDRDPHIASLSDGTLICNWFAIYSAADRPRGDSRPIGIFTSRSVDNGHTWSSPKMLPVPGPIWYACSAPIRELPDHSLILGLYTEDSVHNTAWGATIKSFDWGESWTDLATIGAQAGLYLDAETDVILLKDGSLLAALRSSRTDLYFATSHDLGKSWGPVRSSGFKGHCPIFLRTRGGIILLAHRLPGTAIHWSSDEGKTWQGPLVIDTVIGAYPGLAELPDGTVYCVYYEEGEGSSIRGARLKVTPAGVVIADRATPPQSSR